MFNKPAEEGGGIALDEEKENEVIEKSDNKNTEKKARKKKIKLETEHEFSNKEKYLSSLALNYFIDMNNKNKLFDDINGLKNNSQSNNKNLGIALGNNLGDAKQDLCKFYALGREFAFSSQKIETDLKYKANEFIPSLPFFDQQS